MLSTIIAILALGFIVFFHELGHFTFARLFHVGVIEFTIGLGPKIVSVLKNRTRWSISALPFGGACAMLSEDSLLPDDMKQPDGSILVDGVRFEQDEQLVRKPAWQRFLIFSGGALFNFILALWLSFVLTGLVGSDRPVLAGVTDGSPAMEAGLEAGDTVTRLAIGKSASGITFSRDIQLFLLEHHALLEAGEPVVMTYRDASEAGEVKQAVLTPREDPETGRKLMGFSYSMMYTPVESVGELLRFSIANVGYCIRSTVMSLRMLVSGSVNKDDVMGPVRMVAEIDETVGEAAKSSLLSAALTLMNMMILISGSLGCMNLLPIPALDGGRIVFVLLEMIFRRPVPKRFETAVNGAGMLLLLALMFFILFNDITYLIFGR